MGESYLEVLPVQLCNDQKLRHIVPRKANRHFKTFDYTHERFHIGIMESLPGHPRLFLESNFFLNLIYSIAKRLFFDTLTLTLSDFDQIF